jgi:phage FluMu gp28-like protein
MIDVKTKILIPGHQLLPYQRRWVNDHARWKFGLMARQVGKDFSSGFEGMAECALAESRDRKIDWLIAAPSERQSLESLERWKEWAHVFKLSLADVQELREAGGESLLKSATITFPHGSRVIAVPGKPETVRGFSANVLLTEFAFFEQPAATWSAILPSVTNQMRGLKKVRLITTPNGIGNMAHDLWTRNYNPKDEGGRMKDEVETSAATSEFHPSSFLLPPSSIWSCHFVDIHQAKSEGLPINIEQLKAAFNFPDGWAQEYECQFLDVQSTLLPYELIATCESAEARDLCPPEYWQSRPPYRQVMGIDFGRHRHLTVAWVLAQSGDVWQTMEVLVLEKMPSDQQEEILRQRLRQCDRVCFDYTGPGVGLGDYLVKEFRAYEPEKHKFGKIELCHFSNTLKVEIFSKLRMAFEKRSVRVPQSRAIREDLHSMNRVSTPTGQITYRAPYSPDGHADRCTALALALRAAQQGHFGCSIESVSRGAPRLGFRTSEERVREMLEREKYRFLNVHPSWFEPGPDRSKCPL